MLNFKRMAIASKIRNDPFYRFQSTTEIAIAAELGIKIDVNQADIDDWLRLPGISIHQAKILTELVRRGIPLVCLEDIAGAINVSAVRLLPLEPILYFAYYEPTSSLSPQRLNINQAELPEIKKLPLGNNRLPRKILKERAVNGKFQNILDFQSRLKLDNKLIANLLYYLRF